MTFKTIAGGFELSNDELTLVRKQRAITKAINEKFIQVGAVFLRMSSKNPIDDDWFSKSYRDTNLQDWIDDQDKTYYNVGFNLQMGWMDVDIDASDPLYNECIIAAMRYLGIDCRFKFGRMSVGHPTHVFLQLGEDEAINFEQLSRFEPKEFKYRGKRYHVQLRSFPVQRDAKSTQIAAKQTVVPGSIYFHKEKPDTMDMSVWYTDKGMATVASEVAATTPRRVNFNEVVRAITFGTFAYVLSDYWVEGSRQSTAQKVTGWLARVVKDSYAINNNEAIAREVYCPIDTSEMASDLLYFVCDFFGDDEKAMRVRAFRDAVAKLDRNPDAKIPGWPAIEQMLGGDGAIALRSVFMPGSDVSQLTKMADRYLYDESDNRYIDRNRFITGGNYVHDGMELERRHRGDVVKVGGKPREAFKVYEASDMRIRIGGRRMDPDLPTGIVYRANAIDEILTDDDEDDTSLAYFNTWSGWPVQPAMPVDQDYLDKCVGMLDTVLRYLTCDNEDQVAWIKKWMAWTIQHPSRKQQIAWVVVGGQGVGKSFIGSVFLPALMGRLAGQGSPKLVDDKFNIAPFLDKMLVFIDEAKFHGESGTDEIKKLIRNVDIAGAKKFEDATTFKVYARIMFASNRFDMNIGQSNTRDRALFYTRAYDAQYKEMSDVAFSEWAETLKPFFSEFASMLRDRKCREHFMHYLSTLPVELADVESIKYSASSDPTIVSANMSWSRKIAKLIIEEGRIFEELDISHPFTFGDVAAKAQEVGNLYSFKNVSAQRVMAEFEAAGLVEKVRVGGKVLSRFSERIGSLHEKFGKHIGVEMEPRYEFSEDDFGPNTNDGSTIVRWRGASTSRGLARL